MLLLCAIILEGIASAKKKGSDDYAWRWQILAMRFLGLSLDETVGLHEMTIKPSRCLLGASGMPDVGVKGGSYRRQVQESEPYFVARRCALRSFSEVVRWPGSRPTCQISAIPRVSAATTSA
jgi:hypothetical protein